MPDGACRRLRPFVSVFVSGGARAVSSKPAASSTSSPVVNALLMGSALVYGLWMLVNRGRISWPPRDLLANAYTLAGCLALVGPVLLARRDAVSGGLGELLWMTGGLLVWVFDAAALVQGRMASQALTTPLGYQTMGLIMLAVLGAGLRIQGTGGRNWSWTNVTGWVLGLFWVGMGLAALFNVHAPSLSAAR